ncbi:MAG: gamma-butyrobetaine hydroxylase-like domain-containing protein [Porticoccaceae bacterium]
MPTATEIRLDRRERVLHVSFDDGGVFALPAEYLRVESPSAEVQGHGPDQKQIVPNKRSVAITAIEPVGNYAVRLVFDDGHDTGIFSWDYLHELGLERERRWSRYLDALSQRGLSRGP